MGTIPNKKPKNSITLSRGGDRTTKMRDIGDGVHFEVEDRSFAQKSPSAPENDVTPQAHASVEEEVEAVERNTQREEEDVETPEVDDDEESTDSE